MQPMLTIALRAARNAGELIVRDAEELDLMKADDSRMKEFVAETNHKAEQEIIYHLRKAYPDHTIHGEESGSENADSEYEWIIDPLDGTQNFLRGIPHFAVAIACLHKGKVEHAVILDPIRREEFTASRGRGASLNGRRIRVSNARLLDDTLLAVGIPARGKDDRHIEGFTKGLATITAKSAGVRQSGASSLDFAYVAAGRVDGYWELSVAPWNLAAGTLLLKEAGGLVVDLEGGVDYMKSGNVIAATPKLIKPLLQNIRPHLNI